MEENIFDNHILIALIKPTILGHWISCFDFSWFEFEFLQWMPWPSKGGNKRRRQTLPNTFPSRFTVDEYSLSMYYITATVHWMPCTEYCDTCLPGFSHVIYWHPVGADIWLTLQLLNPLSILDTFWIDAPWMTWESIKSMLDTPCNVQFIKKEETLL